MMNERHDTYASNGGNGREGGQRTTKGNIY